MKKVHLFQDRLGGWHVDWVCQECNCLFSRKFSEEDKAKRHAERVYLEPCPGEAWFQDEVPRYGKYEGFYWLGAWEFID